MGQFFAARSRLDEVTVVDIRGGAGWSVRDDIEDRFTGRQVTASDVGYPGW